MQNEGSAAISSSGVKCRLTYSVGACLLLAIAGALVGYLLGRTLAVNVAEARLADYAGVIGAMIGAAAFLIGARNRSMKNRFLRAIRRGEVDVLYQPLVDMGSRRVTGVEALIRWADYDGSTLPPELLVKIAEEFGFIGEITELVLKRALRELTSVFKTRSDFRLNINVSAFDLTDPIFLPMVERMLEKAEISPRRIGIELTETSTADRGVAAKVISQLRDAGHYVCLDDFGTGYSSLSYLQDLAVDAIKIDRSFTRAIGTDSVTVSILPQILAIASSLNLHVVVEGIETEEQADYFLATGGQMTGQGWLFGIPVSANNLVEALERSKKLEFSKSAFALQQEPRVSA